MKKGWVYKKLGEVCEIYQPTTIATSQLIPNGKYLVYGANGIIGRYNEYNHEEAEVLLCCRGATCGAINLSQPKSWVNGNAMVVKPKTNEIIKNFLIYLLTSLDYTHIITGAAQPQITRKSLFPVSIGLPPLSEQKEIVEYLDSSFAKIDKLKENAAKNLEEAKALFQSALKDALEPKEGWEEKTLEYVATDMYRGSGIKRDQVTEEGISCVRYGEIYTTYNFYFDVCKSHTNEGIITSKKYFENGDILFAITGESVEEIGKSIAYLGKEKCLAGGDIVVMKHNQNPKFLSYALTTPNAIKQKGYGKTKLKVVHTNIPSLKTIKIPIPSLSEQIEIAEFLDSLNEKVNTLQQNYSRISNECDALKQAILRQVFE